YQGNYIINWCPRCHTALSDEEASHRELQGHLYYLKYPLKESSGSAGGGPAYGRHKVIRSQEEFIVVATTRPETMLGDTAVAVNPKDKRYKKLIGRTLILPLIEREIKIIADNMVDMKFGTGAVKVTPAHDPNDYALGKKHGLEFINVMHPDGRMNENAGDYKDMDRFEAREVILEDLKEKGLLEKAEPHALSAGHCYRCHTIIEPYLSKQWFVKMKPLAKPAVDVVKKGKIKFYPARWTKVYLNWMDNIQDWCISRQIWWGHRIPVYYCMDCQEVIVSRTKPEKCPKCSSVNIEQDPDVLDTWFSSWLWPFATFYWPFTMDERRQTTDEEDLKYFYPTNVLVTAQEIIFFWVARMIMAGLEFKKEIPFRDVYIHGTVRDDTGTKMSKSLGNIIDPLEIIDSVGADALRFSMILITATGQDVFLSPRKFEIGRNFANKVWNASRYILTVLKDNINVDLCIYAKDNNLSIADRWILSRLYSALSDVAKSLDRYRLNDAASRIYEFFWHDFCDWYIEFSKLSQESRTTQVVLYKVLEKSMRMLHPFMPFITEEIWQNLPLRDNETPIMASTWPHMQKQLISAELEESVADIIEVMTAMRNIRSEWNIDAKSDVDAVLSFKNAEAGEALKEFEPYIKRLCRVGSLQIGKAMSKPPHSAYAASKIAEVYIPLKGIIDFEKESARLRKKRDEINKNIEVMGIKLKDKNFTDKAPKEIVEKHRASHAELKNTLKRLDENLKDIS
ncbi:MAG: valine--tRNA ligase, partial [Candidatus Omnitrophota bacterium]|nr:valine--tRNA ligase [Candidatus Omnitrophota bacterium]